MDDSDLVSALDSELYRAEVNQERIELTHKQKPGAIGRVFHLVFMLTVVLVPTGLLLADNPSIYVAGATISGIVASLAMMAAMALAQKVEAYASGSILHPQSKLVIIRKKPAQNYRDDSSKPTVEVDGVPIKGHPKSVVNSVSPIVMANNGIQRTILMHHANIVFDHVIIRVGTFKENPDAAIRLTKGLMAGLELSSVEPEPVVEISLENSTMGMWGSAALGLVDLGVYAGLAYALAPSDLSSSLRLVVVGVLWCVIHWWLFQVSIRKLRDQLREIATKFYAIAPSTGEGV